MSGPSLDDKRIFSAMRSKHEMKWQEVVLVSNRVFKLLTQFYLGH